jgi:hypothetical protein
VEALRNPTKPTGKTNKFSTTINIYNQQAKFTLLNIGSSGSFMEVEDLL